MLVAGALLFSRSLNKLLTAHTGFRQEGVLIADVGFGRLNVPPERRLEFKNDLLSRVRTIPGVEAASETSIVPLSGNSSGNDVWLDGADSQQRKNTYRSIVGPIISRPWTRGSSPDGISMSATPQNRQRWPL